MINDESEFFDVSGLEIDSKDLSSDDPIMIWINQTSPVPFIERVQIMDPERWDYNEIPGTYRTNANFLHIKEDEDGRQLFSSYNPNWYSVSLDVSVYDEG